MGIFDKKKIPSLTHTPPFIEEKLVGQEVSADKILATVDTESYRAKRAKALQKKRRCYWLIVYVRRIKRYWSETKKFLSDNLGVILMVALLIFAALFGYCFAFIRLHFSIDQIKIGIWDFFSTLGSLTMALIVMGAKIFTAPSKAEREIADDARKENIGDNDRTLV
jgi:hypothetical protein